MGKFRLELLGGFQLFGPAGQEIAVPGSKLQTFLAYLALNLGHPRTREHLAAMFWGEAPEKQARQNLRKSLARLRRVFVDAAPEVLDIDHHRICLKREHCEVDALDFKCRAAESPVADLPAAMPIYRGDFMAGVNVNVAEVDDWLATTRAELLDIAAQAWRRLAVWHGDEGRTDQAISAAKSALDLDPLTEDMHRFLMRSYATAGNRPLALSHYRELSALLATELDTEPEAETKELYAHIRVGARRDRVSRIWTDLRPTVAFVPVLALTTDRLSKHLARSLTEDLIERLTHFHGLAVIAPSGGDGENISCRDLRSVSENHSVSYIFRSSLRIVGSRLRIVGALIDVGNGANFWSDRFDRLIGNAAQSTDDAADAITVVVAQIVSHAEQQRAARELAHEFDAWDNYQRGLWHFFNYTGPDRIVGRTALQTAIRQDPNLAPAYSFLAFSILSEARLGWTSNPRRSIRSAYLYAQKSVGLDNRNEMILSAYALASSWFGKHDTALLAGDRAVEVNPLNCQALYSHAMAMIYAGHYEQSLPIIERAIEIGPEDPIAWLFYEALATARYGLGEFEAAGIAARRSLALKDRMLPARTILGAALGQLGETTEAARALTPIASEQTSVRRHILERFPFTNDYRRSLRSGLRKVREIMSVRDLAGTSPVSRKLH